VILVPKQTYFNLPKEKQKRIFDAGLLEFSYKSYHNASVNTIVRIAEIPKGSFYQYFVDKKEFYWYIVTETIYGNMDHYEGLLEKHNGDFLKAEEELFLNILDLFDNKIYNQLITNVFKETYFELLSRLSDKSTTIFFKMYDVLMKFGFKEYEIHSKEDFIVIFDLIRSVSSTTILHMIAENWSKQQTKQRYKMEMKFIQNGIRKKGFFR